MSRSKLTRQRVVVAIGKATIRSSVPRLAPTTASTPLERSSFSRPLPSRSSTNFTTLGGRGWPAMPPTPSRAAMKRATVCGGEFATQLSL